MEPGEADDHLERESRNCPESDGARRARPTSDFAESRVFASCRPESVAGADVVKALEELVAAGPGACHPIG